MTTTYAMPLELDLGPVELTVGDLDRSLEYYTSSIGLQVLEQGSGSAQLGVAGRPLAVLQEIPGAAPAPSSSAGLSHFAPRVPSRADLARFARHCIDQGLDTDLRAHGNAESAYVIDADGHTVEVTWHRPRVQWDLVDGKPAIVADPVELEDLRTEPGSDLPFTGLPTDTTMSHVQLKVTDAELAKTEPFYTDMLGLDVIGRLGSRFLALGVNDHSRLVVTNRFSQPDSPPAPDDSARLLRADLLVPTASDVQTLAAHLTTAGYPHELHTDALKVCDPSGNRLRVRCEHS